MFDSKDEKILKELQRDASQSALQISRKVRLPRSTVQHRIDRMKAKKIIKRIVAIPDYPQIGLPVIAFVLVTYNPIDGVSQQDVARAIAKIEKVVEDKDDRKTVKYKTTNAHYFMVCIYIYLASLRSGTSKGDAQTKRSDHHVMNITGLKSDSSKDQFSHIPGMGNRNKLWNNQIL